MVLIREYLDHSGASPFANWFNRLDPQAAAKVTTGLARVEQGNLSNVKGVGRGVLECRINFGPGYRIYLDGTARASSFYSLAARSNASNRTSKRLRRDGVITPDARRSVEWR
jgi:putative addiction module killer protein